MSSPVQAPALVLVTGVNGNVASCITLRLLESGYSVRGTVRRLPSANHVKKTFERFGSRFTVVEVGDDIAKDDAFKEAVVGVDAVVHTASPVTMDSTRPEQQYVPSIKGTLSILRSAKNEPSIKRFLYLGSTGSAVMGPQDPTKQVVTRENWNTYSTEAVKNLDDPAIGFHIYLGSKVEAEKALWRFSEEEKPSFSVTAILASLVVGPIPSAVTAPPRQDLALGQAYNCFANPPRVPGLNPIVSTVWVNSLDVADLFVQSLTSSKTANMRLLAHAGMMSWVQFADALRKEYPDRHYPPASEDVPRMDFPGARVLKFDTALEEELLGGKWRTLEETALMFAKDILEKEARGWDKL